MADQQVAVGSAAPPTKHMRADARRNSARIVEVAKQVFIEAGLEAPLDEIVKRAGIGAGTLYRHFPTREALLEAVYREEIIALADLGARLRAELPPEQAIAQWLDAQLSFVFANRGLAMSLKAAMDRNGESFDYCRRILRAEAKELLAPLQEAGVVRADIEPVDILRMTHAVSIATDQDGIGRAGKLLDIMLAGLGLPAVRRPVA
ncbi:MAG TPA: helix-turn-helix domain-containing protein [Pseudonocardiaceae bacterium]|nr:helix-turn-helix domain-containing protein [Pseudonocardiaceae bacterium]